MSWQQSGPVDLDDLLCGITDLLMADKMDRAVALILSSSP